MRSSGLLFALSLLATAGCGSGFSAGLDGAGSDAGADSSKAGADTSDAGDGGKPVAGSAGVSGSAGTGDPGGSGSVSSGGSSGSQNAAGAAGVSPSGGSGGSGGTQGNAGSGSAAGGGGVFSVNPYPECERDYASLPCGAANGITFRYFCASQPDPSECAPLGSSASPGAKPYCCQKNDLGCTVAASASSVPVGVRRCGGTAMYCDPAAHDSRCREYLYSGCSVAGNPVPDQCTAIGVGEYCCSGPYLK